MVEWLIENKLFVNRNKFQASLLGKQNTDYTATKLTAGSEEIQVVSSVDVTGVTTDYKLNFALHIDRIYKSASKSNQLNVERLFEIRGKKGTNK